MDIKAMLGAKKKLDPLEKEAKLNAIKDMRKVAGDMMTDGAKSKMEKVTVAAPDKESLAMGLDKAKDILASKEDSGLSTFNSDSEEQEGEDSMEDQAEELQETVESCDTPEKIDEMMKKLAEKKASLMQE